MVNNYKVITLCGSTRFKEDFERVNKELTLAGNIVISVGCFGHAGDVFSDKEKEMLDDIHKRKIDMADEIFVINKDGYIGASTKSEIEYAISKGKTVKYMIEMSPIYQINILGTPYYKTGLGFPECDSKDFVGFYYEEETAIRAVEENWCNIQECYAKAAEIKIIEPGLYPTKNKIIHYYLWNTTERKFKEVPIPQFDGVIL